MCPAARVAVIGYGNDVIIGALRISTFDTPPIVTAGIVRRMRPGSVIVDVTAGLHPDVRRGYLATL